MARIMEWSLPCEFDKCCSRRGPNFKKQKESFDIDFRLPGIDKMKLIEDYRKLVKGNYSARIVWYSPRRVLFILFYALTLPIPLLLLPFAFLSYLVLVTFIVLRTVFIRYICRCCCANYEPRLNTFAKHNAYTTRSLYPGENELSRFVVYKSIVYLVFMVLKTHWRGCQYLSGFFAQNLISDEVIIYFIHLWPTTTTQYVYKDNEIVGITEDYSSWSSNESVDEFFEGMTFEILSVFIDYEDQCRISFNLRNGETIKQPRFGRAGDDKLTEKELDELRVWNIVKAHYQSMVSIWPALIHTWAHFHFNDLTIQFEDRQDTNTTMDIMIRSHTYYTAVLNGAGMETGWMNPHMVKLELWSMDSSFCHFLCVCWKAVLVSAEVFQKHTAEDITNHYFIDVDEDDDDDERDLMVAASSSDESVIDIDEEKEQQKGLKNKKKTKLKKKTANPDAFPPKFVQNRLEMFNSAEWVRKHRGLAIYKDYLTDNYRVIYEDFVVPLNKSGFVTHEDLKRWVDWMDGNGFAGVAKCKRDDGYEHIFATFIWLNVVHACDHTVANNIVRDFGIGASYIAFEGLDWCKEHKGCDSRDVLEGKGCWRKWRLQFYAMRNRMFWGTHGAPGPIPAFRRDICFVAHNFVDSHLYRRFKKVDNISNEDRRSLNVIHRNFTDKIRDVGAPYHWLMDVEDITAGIHY